MVLLRDRAVIFLLSLLLVVAGSLPARAEKKHPAEEKGVKSTSGDVETTVTFVNKSGKTVKVYWLDYDGQRQPYGTVQDGDSHEQPTYLTHPWLITDENDNAWYVYFPDAQPRTVEILAPPKK